MPLQGHLVCRQQRTVSDTLRDYTPSQAPMSAALHDIYNIRWLRQRLAALPALC